MSRRSTRTRTLLEQLRRVDLTQNLSQRLQGHGARSQQRWSRRGQVKNGAFKAEFAASAVQNHQIEFRGKVLSDVARKRRTDMTRSIGTRRAD